MSKSLVHNSLELLEYDKYLRPDKTKKKKKKQKDGRYKGVLDLIPDNHRTISKHNTDLDIILNQSNKVTISEVQKRLAAQGDPTDKNIKQLLLLSKNRVNPETANKLFHRAVKKTCVMKQDKSKDSEKTAFTEEDFAKFEKEYKE